MNASHKNLQLKSYENRNVNLEKIETKLYSSDREQCMYWKSSVCHWIHLKYIAEHTENIPKILFVMESTICATIIELFLLDTVALELFKVPFFHLRGSHIE